MSSKRRNFSPSLGMHHDSESPDPLLIIAREESTQSSRAPNNAQADEAPSPRCLSDEERSPPVSRRMNFGRTLAHSPERDHSEDFSDGSPAQKKLDFRAVGSRSVAEDASSAATSDATGISDIPGDIFSLFGDVHGGSVSPSRSASDSLPEPQPETQSGESSTEDEDVPLIPRLPPPPPPRVWHSADGVGTVLLPVRHKSKFPSKLREAERTMASQITSALGNPRDEGLGSATFQTLLDTFLLPRLKGVNGRGERVKVHQYSQFAARRGQQQSGVASEYAKNDLKSLKDTYELDPEDVEYLEALAKRRVPDMTAMAVFEKEEVVPGGVNYRLESRRGPKMCITEIKAFNWSGDHDILDHVLAVAVLKAHRQNYVAAQFLFAEDDHLHHVASFVGVGPVWLYGECHRTLYLDVHGMQLPRDAAEARRYREPPAQETPKKAGPSRKRPRTVYSPEEQVDDEQGVADSEPVAPPVRQGPNTRAVKRSQDTGSYLTGFGFGPWTAPDNIQEIFTRRPAGDSRVQVKPRDVLSSPLPYIYVLDPDGRTYEAFDAIVERIRGWYTNQECPAEYRIEFDEDPYAGGSCPATMAKMKGKERA